MKMKIEFDIGLSERQKAEISIILLIALFVIPSIVGAMLNDLVPTAIAGYLMTVYGGIWFAILIGMTDVYEATKHLRTA
jgi:hypothetical protein